MKLVFRFRLIWLFVVTLVLCVSLAWYSQHQGWVVDAKLAVKGHPTTEITLLDGRQPSIVPIVVPVPRAALKEWVADTDTWERVLGLALANPQLAGNKILTDVERPSNWLRENVNIEFGNNCEAITLRLRCRAAGSRDAKTLLRILADSLAAHLNSRDHIVRQQMLDNLEVRKSLIETSIQLESLKYKAIEDDPTIEEQLREQALHLRRDRINELKAAEAQIKEILLQLKEEETNVLEVSRKGRVTAKRTWWSRRP